MSEPKKPQTDPETEPEKDREEDRTYGERVDPDLNPQPLPPGHSHK
jgi:hypothetical protein